MSKQMTDRWQMLPIEQLVKNEGQIPGLPANPRSWTEKEKRRMAKSLKETPQLYEGRPLLVIPYNGVEESGCYVVLGGNLRLEGSLINKDKEVPCWVLDKDLPLHSLEEIVIKDNGSFGNWDYDALANEWDELPLTEWGVPAWDTEPAEETEEEEKESDLKFVVEVELPDAIACYTLMDEMTERGYKCKMK